MLPSESSTSRCPSCGAKLDPTILGGSCSACLFGGVIGGEENEQEALNDAPEVEGYEVLEEIGSGGMGVVYRARQESPAREVALKIVAPFSLRASEARARFLVEIEAMAAVEHPGLLPLYDAGEDEHGRPWLTMQLASGGTLAEGVSSFQGEWKKAAALVISLCEAIQYAHERGILHRDLKPANILFDDEGNGYVADFGLAKWADDDSSVTRSSAMLGSPAYLAPEAARGGSKLSTTVSDVYGLGAILYELLVGKKPYEGNQPAEVLTQILDGSPVAPRKRLKKIPRDLEVIVLKAMAREPSKRYHSAAAFADDLTRWSEGKAIEARPVGWAERAVIWARRNPAVATLSLLFLGSLVTGGVLLWKSNQELEASLDDAEARVEFMTRELPASLAPLGRLDLLDDVFENVSEHYEENRRDDPESRARHADFLTQWSQIHRPRGQIEKAVTRAKQALQEATSATQDGETSVRGLRARASAGWRLGEALIEADELAEARKVLEGTKEFIESQGTDDFRFRIIEARLAVEYLLLEQKEGHFEEAQRHGEHSLDLWKELLPRFDEEGDFPAAKEARLAGCQIYFQLYEVVRDQNEEEKAAALFNDWMEEARTVHLANPGDLIYHHQYAEALLSSVWTELTPQEEVQGVLEECNGYFEVLISRDPGNVRWLSEAADCAIRLADHAEQRNAPDEQEKWMAVAAERVGSLYKFGSTTELRFLMTRREVGARCGIYLVEKDWRQARFHFKNSVATQVQIAFVSGNSDESARLDRMLDRMMGMITERDGKEAAEEWQATIQRKDQEDGQ